jgi:hypothetical protein
MIEECLPPQSRQFYIRVRAQKHEGAMADHRERLIRLRAENAARGSLLTGQQLLAEWQLSEKFVGAMATGTLEAALETCELYEIPLDQNLSSCIETEIKGFIDAQFRHALRNHSTSNGVLTMPTNIKGVFAGRIPAATFKILNPIQIRLERVRVTGLGSGSDRKGKGKEKSGNMGLELSSAEQAVMTALGEAYPQKVHLHQLAAKMIPPLEHGELLQAVDGLHSRRLIECKPLKGAEGLVDAANILLSSEGARWLEEADSSKESPAVVKILNVLISSPSDVNAERDAVESAIQEWNINHHKSTGILLHPVRWETHAFPALGDRPQGILNRQIVSSAHFLIGIFGNRLGTPTGEAPSGTIEEIEEIRKSGRHVSLYFSNAPVPRDVDRAQLDALEDYRRSVQQRGLYFTFASVDELRRLVTQHLPKIVDEVRANMKSGSAAAGLGTPSSVAQQPMKRMPTTVRTFATGLLTNDDLNPKEVELLWNAAKSSDGEIYHSSTLDGEGIRANERHFLVEADARTASEWLSALRGLENRGFIEPLSDERDFFKLTGEGYAAADQLEDFARWKVHSITLRAYYMNADPHELKLDCKGIVALPATYYPDDIGADLSVQKSLKERRSLLVEGLGSMPNIDWQPTDVEFKDDATGKVETFRVDGMEYVRPGRLKLPIVSG